MSRRPNRNRRVTRRQLKLLHAEMGARAAKLLDKYDALEITRIRARLNWLEATLRWRMQPWWKRLTTDPPEYPDLSAVVNDAMAQRFPDLCDATHPERRVQCEEEAGHEGEHRATVLRRVTADGAPKPEEITWANEGGDDAVPE